MPAREAARACAAACELLYLYPTRLARRRVLRAPLMPYQKLSAPTLRPWLLRPQKMRPKPPRRLKLLPAPRSNVYRPQPNKPALPLKLHALWRLMRGTPVQRLIKPVLASPLK